MAKKREGATPPQETTAADDTTPLTPTGDPLAELAALKADHEKLKAQHLDVLRACKAYADDVYNFCARSYHPFMRGCRIQKDGKQLSAQMHGQILFLEGYGSPETEPAVVPA